MPRFVQTFAAMIAMCCAAAWAGYTPFDQLSPEAQQQILDDWSFQADNAFDAGKVANEIKWAKEAAERIGDLSDDIDLSDKVAKLDELQKIVRPDVFYEGMHKLLQLTKANSKNKAFSEEDMATVEKIVLELDEWGGVRDPELRSKFEEYERLFKLHEKNQDELERLELILEKYYELDSLLTQPKREGPIFPHL